MPLSREVHTLPWTKMRHLSAFTFVFYGVLSHEDGFNVKQVTRSTACHLHTQLQLVTRFSRFKNLMNGMLTLMKGTSNFLLRFIV